MALAQEQSERGAGARRALGGTQMGLGLLLVAAILVMVNYLGHRHYRRGDWTRRGIYSVSERTTEMVKALAQDVDITVFMGGQLQESDAKDSVFPELRELLTRISRLTTRAKVTYFDPDREPERAKQLIKQFGVTSDDVLRGGVVVVKAGERKKYIAAEELSEFGAGEGGPQDRRLKAFKGEQALLSAILTVTEGKQAQICTTVDHDEGDLESFDERRGYSAFGEALKRDNHQVKKLKELDRGVPQDCSLVMILGPQRPFAEGEIRSLDSYLGKGGKLMAFVGPTLDKDGKLTRLGLEPLLAKWGARLGDNVVVDQSAIFLFERNPFTWGTRDGYGDHPVAQRLRGRLVSFPFARSVTPESTETPNGKLTSKVVVRTSSEGYGETSFTSVVGDAELRYDPATDLKGPVPVVVGASTELRAGAGPAGAAAEETRVMVFGTPSIVQNYRLEAPPYRSPVDDDIDLVMAGLSWTLKSERLVAVGPKTPEHIKLILSDDQIRRIFTITVVLIPLTVLLLGGALWYGRRS
jgi:hypothetical protein